MESRWSEAQAAGQPDLEGLLYASRLVGADQSLVLWGGGNTSAKVQETDFRGRPVAVLRVKGSGSDLRTIRVQDFPGVRLEDVLPLLQREAMADEEMVAYLAHTLMEPASPRPSIETLLHAFLPPRFVVHTHADAILSLTNTVSGRRQVADALGRGRHLGGLPPARVRPLQGSGRGLPGFARGDGDRAGEARPDHLGGHRPGGLRGHRGDGDPGPAGCVSASDVGRRAGERRRRAGSPERPTTRAPARRAGLRPDAGARVYRAVAPLIRGLAGRTRPDGSVLPPVADPGSAPHRAHRAALRRRGGHPRLRHRPPGRAPLPDRPGHSRPPDQHPPHAPLRPRPGRCPRRRGGAPGGPRSVPGAGLAGLDGGLRGLRPRRGRQGRRHAPRRCSTPGPGWSCCPG